MKVSRARKTFVVINYIILAAVTVVTIYPILHVLAASLSKYTYIAKGEITFYPKGVNIDAYIRVFNYPMIWRSYFNTVLYTVLGTAINIVLTAMAAYPLSRRPFAGQKFMNFLIVITMLFNAGMIPSFLIVRNLHLYDTIWAIVIPGALSSFNVILLRNFFDQIPVELEESASLDGCSQMKILFKIFLPLAKPGIMTVALFYAVGHWNSYFTAMLYLQRRTLAPLQIVLRDIVINSNMSEMAIDSASAVDQIGEAVKYATIMFATLPIMFVYPFVQKYFVKGIMVGSVKG